MDQGNDRHSRHLPGKAERTERESMTVDEIRDARQALEQQILHLCERFRADVVFAVTGCEIHTASIHQMQDKYPRRATVRVAIELESI